MLRHLKRRAALPAAALTLALLGQALPPAARPALAADVKEVKLDAAQQDAANKLRAKGAAVSQIAADTDALTVNLGIVGKQATDEDLALVKLLPKVQQLDLHGTAVTDAGLANLAGLTGLTQLHLERTGVTDAGLVHLKGLTSLDYLNLYHTAVTDEGLKHLEGLKKLRKVYLWETKVSADGANALKAAVPEVAVNRGEELTLPPPASKPADAKEAKPAVAVADKKPEVDKKPDADKKPAAEKKDAEKKPAGDKPAVADAKKVINATCPVSGKPVDPTHTVLYQGKTIGFCCPNCPAAFEKEPAKFLAKIPEWKAIAAAEAPAADKPAPDKPAPDKPAPENPTADKPAADAGEKKAKPKKPATPDIDGEGFIRTWLVFGPISIDGSGGEEIDKALLPDEAKLHPKAGDKAKVHDKEIAWKKVTATDFFVDFNEALKADGETNVAAYAVAYIDSAEERTGVTLLMGSNDEGKAFLNGKEATRFNESRTLDKDTEKAENLTLKKGVNVVVLKVINESNNWQGCVRLVDKDGKPVAGLTVKTEP